MTLLTPPGGSELCVPLGHLVTGQVNPLGQCPLTQAGQRSSSTPPPPLTCLVLVLAILVERKRMLEVGHPTFVSGNMPQRGEPKKKLVRKNVRFLQQRREWPRSLFCHSAGVPTCRLFHIPSREPLFLLASGSSMQMFCHDIMLMFTNSSVGLGCNADS